MTSFTRIVAFTLLILVAANSPAQDALTYDRLRRLLERGFDQKEIVLLVQKSSVRITERQIEDLKKAGAKAALIKALRGKIGGDILAKLITAARAGKDESAQIRIVMERGLLRKITAAEALRLMDAGVSDNAVRALEGKYVFPGFRAWRDPLSMLSIQLPQGWHAYHWYTSGGVKMLFSPQADVRAVNQFTTGLQIQVSALRKGSPAHKPGYKVVDAHKRDLPALIALNRNYKLVPVSGALGEPRALRVAGVPAVEQDFDVVMLATPCRETMLRFHADGLSFFTECVAPVELFEGLRDDYRRMLMTLRVSPGRASVTQRRTRLEAPEVLELYREAVVAVRSEFGRAGTGFGSGFIVREDGLVLTNHHVVCARKNHAGCRDPRRMQLAKSFKLIWDAKVKGARMGKAHKEIEARLVDTYYSAKPSVDIALLRIPRGREPYRVIPIVTTRSGLVRELDPVIAMGFPEPGRVGIGNLVSTSGAVARVNYITRKFGKEGERRELNDLFHSAKINHGNSGGPCVSLDTGAVVGLNTYVPLNAQGESLEYSGTVLIDHILWHFPQIRWYPKGRLPTADEHLELGAMLLAVGNRRSAIVEFNAAAKERDSLDPEQRARLSYEQFVAHSQLGNTALANRLLDDSLAQDDRYVPALREKAYAHAYAKRLDEAVRLMDRMILLNPDDYGVYLNKADIYRIAKSSDDGLASIRQALTRGGGRDSWLHRVAGALHYQKKENDKGRAAYTKAVELNPNDVAAHIGALEYYELTKNPNQLAIAYGRLAAKFPGDPNVTERYGRYLLKDEARFSDAIKYLSRSALISLERDGRAPAGVLDTICKVTTKRKRYKGICLDAAILLHRDGGAAAWRSRAHTRLGDLREALGQKTLAALHRNAANVVVSKRATLATSAVAVNDIATMMRGGYSGLLIGELLDDAGLGFIPDTKNMASLRKIMRSDQATALVSQYLRDQLKGTYGLARGVQVKRTQKFVDVSSDPKGASDILELHNVGRVPLTGLVVRRLYKDKKKKVLWWKDDPLVMITPVLLAGQKRTIRLHYHSWVKLARNKAKRDKIAYFTMRIMSARNAAYLNLIRVDGALVKGKGYRFKVTNKSPFVITKFVIRCDFVDKNGKAIYRRNNQVLFDLKTWTSTLGPNQFVDNLSVADWGNWAYIKKLGVPRGVKAVHHRAFVWEADLKAR